MKQVVHRHPSLAILEEAEAGAYDLLAMATHGRGGAHHLLLGSTADKVMRGTQKPLLLFRPVGTLRAPAAQRLSPVERLFAPEAVVAAM